MMLYEKTLGRKILGVKKEEDSNGAANGEASGAANGKAKENHGILRQMWDVLAAPFRSKKIVDQEKNKPASMGKILNLMR